MFRKRIIIAIFIFIPLSGLKARGLLQAYIDTALNNNPVLKVYDLKSEALKQEIKPARSWDDPMFNLGLENVPVNFRLDEDMMTMKAIGFQQKFSVRKKYLLKEESASKEFEASKSDLEAQRLLLIYRVKEKYYHLYALRKEIETIKSSLLVLENFISIASTRYSTGKGTLQDVLKAQLEVSKMQEELIKMRNEEQLAVAEFNALLLRSKMDSVETDAEIIFSPVELKIDSMYGKAYENNPELASIKSMIGKDSAEYALAKTEKIPEFTIGGSYGQRQIRMEDGTKANDMFGVMFGFTIPAWSRIKQNPMIARTNINILKSKAELVSMTNELELAIHQTIVMAEKSSSLVSFYEKQLLPQAEQTISAGITGYQENKIDFMTLTDNFLTLYDYRLRYHKSVADYMKAIAELEMLTGTNLTVK